MKRVLAMFLLAAALAAPTHAQTTLGQRGTSIWAIDDTTAVGMADSSRIFDCKGIRVLGVFTRVTHAGGAGDVKIAISFRPYLTDSGSAAVADSISGGQAFIAEQFSIVSHGAGDSSAFGNYTLPTSSQLGSGEYIYLSKPVNALASKWGILGGWTYIPIRALWGRLVVRVLSASANTSRVRVAITGYPY